MISPIRQIESHENTRYLIFAEQLFGESTSKTANVLLRYRPEQIACVVDSRYAGRAINSVNPTIQSNVPIVPNVEASLNYNPTDLVIGVAPAGGQLPAEWRQSLITAMNNGLNIISGLHSYLNNDQELVAIANEQAVSLIDLRQSPEFTAVTRGDWRKRKTPAILTIAPDCAFGKLTAAWELKRQLEKRDFKVGFVATGQTGILLNGKGIVIDAVKGDFISAAVERMIADELENQPDVIVVEGQGSIYHEGFSAVTFGLLHGALPDAFLYVHRPGKHANDYGFHYPPHRQIINEYETIVEWFKPCHTCGCQLDTSKYGADDARNICLEMAEITGLPTTDMVRFPEDNAIELMVNKLKMNSGRSK